MKTLLAVLVSMLMCTSAFAADEAADKANRAKFEKECAALISAGGPCAEVATGGGGRRGCVAKPENLAKASAACKAVIEEWKALPK